MFQSLINELLANTDPGRRTSVGPLAGSGPSSLLAQLARQPRVHIAITSDSLSAYQMLRELRFYSRGEDVEILAFPDWETLPYDNFSPHQDILSERLHTLYRLPHLEQGILVVPISTLMHRLPPVSYIAGNSLVLDIGQRLDVSRFRRHLEFNGYRSVETVFEHGEFALRGSLLDVFPMGSRSPFRIDLLDDEVATLRTFDPESQRTLERVDAIRLLPAREFALHRESVNLFQNNWLQEFNVDHDACPMYTEVAAGRAPGGSEYYLPLFFAECATLFDYLPADCQLITLDDHYSAAQGFWAEVNNRFEEFGIDPRRPLLAPERGFVPVEEFYRQLGAKQVLELRPDKDAPVHFDTGMQPNPQFSPERASDSPMAKLAAFIERHQGPVLVCAESTGRREILLESMQAHAMHPVQVDSWQAFLDGGHRLAMVTAPVDRGLYWGAGQPALITEAQLFGQRVAQRRRRANDQSQAVAHIKNINGLRPGVPVVHLEHGVGRYLGLQTLEIDSQLTEFMALEYADQCRLYAPVASLHLISHYSGSDPDLAPLHRLGSDQWKKARRKAGAKVSDVAAELLAVYARRESRPGHGFALNQQEYEQFSSAFPFEETADQTEAIRAVVQDMRADQVMDRLICGDVGFGKTEVAMRAAFVAVQGGKQVAILVPTTLLAQQHFSSFSDRFADWPVSVEVISRFRSAAEQDAIVKRVESGRVDILIGTHKLLQSGVRYRDLGLLVIDEEHRFGVRQKETIKALRAEVDILTLTATPIPRTLNMALDGLRDLSIIATPPARRLSIKTFIREHNVALIKEAATRETLRGGQVYYLHNEVRTMKEAARKLQELLPELRIGIAHGQLREQQLEQVMSAFYHRQYHILLCSTIIETGIDVPNANTIIIERADKFGLAQLHQLRGRVGRSHHQAYAYLLCPPHSAMTSDAEKRLQAVEASSDLGAGYLLATHDLEIRGAGELLGDEQSGQIHSVGFSLYMEMLERAVASLKRGEIPDPEGIGQQVAEVNLRVPALIPNAYLPDINTRLVLYKRIAAAADPEGLKDIQVEMIDRFGLLPQAGKNLFKITELKLTAAELGIQKIDAGDRGGTIEFSEKTRVHPMSLVRRIQEQPNIFKLAGASRLRFDCELTEPDQRLEFVETLLASLQAESSEAAA